MRIWQRQEVTDNLPPDWKAQRDQYRRYIEKNAIYKTLVQRKGDRALELIGFDPSFWGKRKIYTNEGKSGEDPTIKDTVTTLRAEIDRLENLLNNKEEE
jgi:hypothetical protein